MEINRIREAHGGGLFWCPLSLTAEGSLQGSSLQSPDCIIGSWRKGFLCSSACLTFFSWERVAVRCILTGFLGSSVYCYRFILF